MRMIEFLLLGAMLAALFAELTGDSTLSSLPPPTHRDPRL